MVILLGNFLALLVTMDAAGEGKRVALAGFLVATNVFVFLAVLLMSCFSTQQQVRRREISKIVVLGLRWA